MWMEFQLKNFSRNVKLFSCFVVVPRKDQIIISGLQEVVESGNYFNSFKEILSTLLNKMPNIKYLSTGSNYKIFLKRGRTQSCVWRKIWILRNESLKCGKHCSTRNAISFLKDGPIGCYQCQKRSKENSVIKDYIHRYHFGTYLQCDTDQTRSISDVLEDQWTGFPRFRSNSCSEWRRRFPDAAEHGLLHVS